MNLNTSVLKQQRVKLGLTQQEVAERAGVKNAQYQRLEGGQREITRASFALAYKVLKALDLDIDLFMEGKYQIKEVLYRGYDDRLYHYETGEPVEDE